MTRDWNIVDDETEPRAPATAADALDARRVRSIAMERRAAHRARLRRLLMPIACAAIAARATGQTIASRAVHPAWAGACGAIAVTAFWIGVRAALRRPSRRADRVAVFDDARPSFDGLSAGRSMMDRMGELRRD